MTQEEISKILYQHDIEGLAKMGAPPDEYDSEARMIAEGMSECEDEEGLANLIASVFSKMFCYGTNSKTGVSEKYFPDRTPTGKIAEAAVDLWKGNVGIV